MGHFDHLLVGLSVAIAVLASFTALNLAGRLLAADGLKRVWWLAAASIALGGGIWSMHFVGMLAFALPMPVSYDLGLTVFSLLVAILVVGFGLAIPGRSGPTGSRLAVAGIVVGLGIASMHYLGMAAMRMPGLIVTFRRDLVAASLFIAIGAATAAIWVAFRTERIWEQALASVLMGTAIAGMHYTGMAAATFGTSGKVVHHEGIPTTALALAVAGSSIFLLMLGLTTAYFDRKLARLTVAEAVALQESEERHRALFRNSAGIVLIVTPEGIVTYEGSSAFHILGIASKDIVGRHLGALVGDANVAPVLDLVEAVKGAADNEASLELRIQPPGRSGRDFCLTARNLISDSAVRGIVINLHDITERNRLMKNLQELSETDPLTGMFNRRGLLAHAEKRFEQRRRDQRELTVVMLDIDHFKRVNDAYGHAAGDLVLAMVARHCRAETRSSDILGRWGGEEFVMLIDGTLADAQVIVSRLHASIATATVATIKGPVSVTASFGMVSADPNDVDWETALKKADEALYDAKDAGRNCIRINA